MMLAALVHRLAHLLAEPGRGKVGRLAMDQPPVEPGRAIRPDLPLQINRGKHANAGLPVAAGVIVGCATDQIIGDAPSVGVDPLDDPGAAQRL
ncbi:hypothetical protein D9M68_904980 [compost metagenome]